MPKTTINKQYAYTLNGVILYETLDDLKQGADRKLYRCFPLSLKYVKPMLRLASVQMDIIEYVEDDQETP